MSRNRKHVPKSIASQSLDQILDSTGSPALLKVEIQKTRDRNLDHISMWCQTTSSSSLSWFVLLATVGHKCKQTVCLLITLVIRYTTKSNQQCQCVANSTETILVCFNMEWGLNVLVITALIHNNYFIVYFPTN